MARVCLDCGTPKAPLKEKCAPCGKVTITHEGEARAPLCQRCKNLDTNPDRNRLCKIGYANVNPGLIKRQISKGIDAAWDATTKYTYSCPDFKPRYYDDPGPSANPLSFQEREEIRMFHESGGKAFWFDPHRWDHVSDPTPSPAWCQGRVPLDGEIAGHHKEVFWDPPKKSLLGRFRSKW